MDNEVVAPTSKALGNNPKDLIGSTKVSITKLPFAGVIHGAHGMMDGAEKYGPYNWRDKKVICSIYVDAAMRHFMDWFQGQEQAKDSKVHHLGHAIACASILLDAQETGNLIDDRPVCGDPDMIDRLLDRISETIKQRQKEKALARLNDQLTEAKKVTPKIDLPIANPPMSGPAIDALERGGAMPDETYLLMPNFTGYPDVDHDAAVRKFVGRGPVSEEEINSRLRQFIVSEN